MYFLLFYLCFSDFIEGNPTSDKNFEHMSTVLFYWEMWIYANLWAAVIGESDNNDLKRMWLESWGLGHVGKEVYAWILRMVTLCNVSVYNEIFSKGSTEEEAVNYKEKQIRWCTLWKYVSHFPQSSQDHVQSGHGGSVETTWTTSD